MKNLKYIVMGLIGLAVLATIISAVHWIQQERMVQEEIEKHRHYIFCERLQKGMNKNEVLEILGEYGTFTYGESDLGGGSSEMFGSYDSTSMLGETTIYIVLLDEKYNGAYTQIFDQVKPVCSLQ